MALKQAFKDIAQTAKISNNRQMSDEERKNAVAASANNARAAMRQKPIPTMHEPQGNIPTMHEPQGNTTITAEDVYRPATDNEGFNNTMIGGFYTAWKNRDIADAYAEYGDHSDNTQGQQFLGEYIPDIEEAISAGEAAREASLPIHFSQGDEPAQQAEDEQREQDIQYLQDLPEGEREAYIGYLDDFDGSNSKQTAQSLTQWEQDPDNPWAYGGLEEDIAFEDYVSDVVNGDSEAAKAYRRLVFGSEDAEFDPTQDYAMLATNDSPQARALWQEIYTDPRAQQAYLDLLGENIDTDGVPGISAEEAGAFWDSMREYSPETLSYDPNDEYSRWVYGDMGAGYGGGNFQMDAFNQYYYTNIIANAIEGGDMSYDDLVESGQIGQILDSSGNDLVKSLGLESDWAASQNPNLSDEERQEAYDRYISNLAELNNMYKSAAMGEYYAEGGTGSYIDFGSGDVMSDEDARRIAQDYMLASTLNNASDVLGSDIPAQAIGGLAGIDPSAYAEYGSIDDAFAAEEANRHMAAQAAGYQALLNNNAGGDSGYQFINMDAYNAPYSDIQYGDHGDVIFLDENGNEVANATQINRVQGNRDINDLTGTQYIDPDLAYLVAQNAGLLDAGYGVYGSFEYPELATENSSGNTYQGNSLYGHMWNNMDYGDNEPWYVPVGDWFKRVFTGGEGGNSLPALQNQNMTPNDSARWGYTDNKRNEIEAEEAYDYINAMGGSVQGNSYSSSRG